MQTFENKYKNKKLRETNSEMKKRKKKKRIYDTISIITVYSVSFIRSFQIDRSIYLSIYLSLSIYIYGIN